MVIEVRLVVTLGGVCNGRGHKEIFWGDGNVLDLDPEGKYMSTYKN